jgi:hypothetical protein
MRMLGTFAQGLPGVSRSADAYFNSSVTLLRLNHLSEGNSVGATAAEETS